jgi:RES domain-containing protein/HEPN superfamily RES-like protein
LHQWIRDNGHAATCAFCGKRRLACPFPKLAIKIDEAIREFYRPAEETAHVVEESDNPKYWADGTPANEIIQEIAGVEPDLAAALDSYLSQMEQRDVRDGGDAYYGDTPLEHIDAYPDQFMEVWRCFEERLKHEVRFFDEEGKRLLDELFGGLPSMAGGKTIVTIEPAGEFSTIYRARIVEGSKIELFLKEPAQQIGPPPPLLARAGRMNPVGIPIFYGAFSEKVAVAEVRPPVGASVAVGEFRLLRPVRLLDLPALSSVYHNESIFSPDYDRLRNYVAFLGRVDRLLARPVLPSDEALEYLPTQAVAAYITSVMGLDGVIYRSTQIGADRDPFKPVERKLCNIALFGPAARVEGTSGRSKESGEPVRTMTAPPIFVPGLGEGPAFEPILGEMLPPQTHKEPVAEEAVPDSVIEPVTLRIEPEPRLLKIRSVAVETYPFRAYIFDGSLVIDDFDDDDY